MKIINKNLCKPIFGKLNHNLTQRKPSNYYENYKHYFVNL